MFVCCVLHTITLRAGRRRIRRCAVTRRQRLQLQKQRQCNDARLGLAQHRMQLPARRLELQCTQQPSGRHRSAPPQATQPPACRQHKPTSPIVHKPRLLQPRQRRPHRRRHPPRRAARQSSRSRAPARANSMPARPIGNRLTRPQRTWRSDSALTDRNGTSGRKSLASHSPQRRQSATCSYPSRQPWSQQDRPHLLLELRHIAEVGKCRALGVPERRYQRLSQ